MSYKFLPHTADVMFEARGKSIEDLFVGAAKALNAAQVKLNTLRKRIKKEIKIENSSLEMLLFDFLQELVFIKDTEQILFKDFKIEIKKNEKYLLRATCYGDKINPAQQELLADVKAITLENFKLWKENGFFKAIVIVDV
jgi:SHS2 domain-containing protein